MLPASSSALASILAFDRCKKVSSVQACGEGADAKHVDLQEDVEKDRYQGILTQKRHLSSARLAWVQV